MDNAPIVLVPGFWLGAWARDDVARLRAGRTGTSGDPGGSGDRGESGRSGGSGDPGGGA
jgi:hypothetical protein